MFNRFNEIEKSTLANRMKVLWTSNKGVLNSAQCKAIDTACFVNRSMEKLHEKTTFLNSCLQCLNTYENILKFLIKFKIENHVFFSKYQEYHLLEKYVQMAFYGFNSKINSSIMSRRIECLSEAFVEALERSNIGEKYKLGIREHDTCNFFIDFASYIDSCVSEMYVGQRGINNGEVYETIYKEVTNGSDTIKSFFNVSYNLTLTCMANENHVIVTDYPKRYGLKLPLDDCYILTNGFDCTSFSYCNQCKQSVDIRRQINIEESSECLLLALKRFDVIFLFAFELFKF